MLEIQDKHQWYSCLLTTNASLNSKTGLSVIVSGFVFSGEKQMAFSMLVEDHLELKIYLYILLFQVPIGESANIRTKTNFQCEATNQSD